LGCDAGYLRDDHVAYGGIAALGLQRRPFLLLLPLPAASPSVGHGVLLLSDPLAQWANRFRCRHDDTRRSLALPQG
jgi:hypothetical protein